MAPNIGTKNLRKSIIPLTFCTNCPYNRAPCGCETENEQTGKDYHGLSSMWCILWNISIKREMANTRENHEADKHPYSSKYEGFPTTEVFDDVQSYEGRSKVDSTQNHLCDIRIIDSRTLEDDSAVVKEVVGAGKLLQSLKRNAKCNSVRHPRSCEHLPPWLALVKQLLLMLLLNLCELFCYNAMIVRDSVELCHCAFGLLLAPMSVVISGAFWEENDPNT
jgi:hypothetical protein